MFRVLAIVLLPLAALLACGNPDMANLIYQNQLNLQKLKVGMPRAEAVEVMSTVSTKSAQTHGVPIANPARSESFTDKTGTLVEILHYVTQRSRNYSDTTPLVFKNGRLVGWGSEALRQTR